MFSFIRKGLLKPESKEDYILYLSKKYRSSCLFFLCFLLLTQFCVSLIDNNYKSGLSSLLPLAQFFIVLVSFLGCRSKLLDVLMLSISIITPLIMSYSENEFLAALIVPFYMIGTCMFFFDFNVNITLIHAAIQIIITKFITYPRILEKVHGLSSEQLITAGFATTHSIMKTALIFVGFMLYSYNSRSKMITKFSYLYKQVTSRNTYLETKSSSLEIVAEEQRMIILTFSHEFKNALNGLLGSLRILSEITTDKRSIELLGSANVCSYMLRNFAHNLLDSGKLEQRQLEVSYERCDVAQFFANSWQVISEMIKNKRLKGFIKISKDVPKTLMLDSQKLFQILLNMTSNSLKFTQEGQIYFLVHWYPIDENICEVEEVHSLS